METYTMTVSNNKYHEDCTIEDFMQHVRHCTLDEDAIFNIPIILKGYERRKSFKTKFKALFN